jgi:Exonuclease
LFVISAKCSTQDIFVPPEQVIDTVDLYFVKSKRRKLSLQFLSWFILNEYIQTDEHDSIEDARSALKLFNAYHEFEEKGVFDAKLKELYTAGHNFVCQFPISGCVHAHEHFYQGWKPPGLGSKSTEVSKTSTPVPQIWPP